MTVPDWVIVSAVRYALGRRSYIVSDTTELIMRVWRDLPTQERGVVLRDILEHLNRKPWPNEDAELREAGDRPWRILADWLRKSASPDEIAHAEMWVAWAP